MRFVSPHIESIGQYALKCLGPRNAEKNWTYTPGGQTEAGAVQFPLRQHTFAVWLRNGILLGLSEGSICALKGIYVVMVCICEQLGDSSKLHPSCIGQAWVFQKLSPEDLRALADAAVRKRYERGDNVFTQGQRANEMFLIKAGRVKLVKVTEDGAEMTLDIRQGGDFIGENMLNEDIDYPVTAVCIEDTLTCGFTKENFERLVLDRPTIGLQVIRNLSSRIDSLTSRIGNMSMVNLEDRLYNVLINVAREHGIQSPGGYKILFPLTHEDLSFLVGAHRVSITRALRGLKESGKIIQEGRKLIVQVAT